MSLYDYLVKVVFRVILVTGAASIPMFFFYKILPDTLVYSVLIIGMSVCVNGFVVCVLGLSSNERVTVYDKLRNIVQSKKRRC